MKRERVGLFAVLGAMLSSAVAFAIPVQKQAPPGPPPVVAAPEIAALPHFSAGKTLLVDARLGHASLPRGTSAETYLFASVTGIDAPSTARTPPLDLAIVVDRSGSMKGERIANAIAAAGTAIERMRDGDSVLVVTFDTAAQVVVPRTVIGGATRAEITAAVRAIRLGGDTCVSCGLEAAGRELAHGRLLGTDRVTRMLLLSDGATNHGIVDPEGLRRLAGTMRDRGSAITTIGVDVDFDERVMGTIARESNGNHYFVAQASGLPAVFNKEFDALVASAAGVVVEEVFDRPSRREGSRVLVPLGNFSAKDERSLLVKLRVPTDHDGALPVVDVKLTYRDLSAGADASFGGALGVTIKSEGADRDMDPFVQARVERSLTARTLTEANELVNAGRLDEARARLAARSADLASARAVTRHAPPRPAPARARSFGRDFDDQAAALDEAARATSGADGAPPNSGRAKAAAKDLKRLDMSDPFK